MDLEIKIDGESVLLHDNAATICYALRVLTSQEEIDRVRFALEIREERLSETAAA